jgi:hypothetical protein
MFDLAKQKCKICGTAFHHCSACSDNGVGEFGYCSRDCKNVATVHRIAEQYNAAKYVSWDRTTQTVVKLSSTIPNELLIRIESELKAYNEED